MKRRHSATRWPVWALLREARRRAGITQAELAVRAGTSQPTVAKYERGRAMPDISTLARLVEACGLRLRIELEELDVQSRTGDVPAEAAEDRITRNSEHTELISALRRG